LDNTILVDTSEPKKIQEMFIKEGINHRVEKCLIGDFVCNDVCIERKSMPDFVGSMKGHLQKQLLQMEENYKRPYLIISGSLKDLYAEGQVIARSKGFNPYKAWTVNHHIGALASIATKYNVKVFQVDTDLQLVKLVNKIVEKGFDGKVKTYLDTELVMQKDKMKSSDIKYMMLRCIPKIGHDKAKLLAKKVKIRIYQKHTTHLKADFLHSLDGFGPVLVDQILKVNEIDVKKKL